MKEETKTNIINVLKKCFIVINSICILMIVYLTFFYKDYNLDYFEGSLIVIITFLGYFFSLKSIFMNKTNKTDSVKTNAFMYLKFFVGSIIIAFIVYIFQWGINDFIIEWYLLFWIFCFIYLLSFGSLISFISSWLIQIIILFIVIVDYIHYNARFLSWSFCFDINNYCYKYIIYSMILLVIVNFIRFIGNGVKLLLFKNKIDLTKREIFLRRFVVSMYSFISYFVLAIIAFIIIWRYESTIIYSGIQTM